MNRENISTTDVWRLFDKGRQYNRIHGLYDDTEKNYNFYIGNQWEGADTGSEKPVVKNIIKPIVKYKLGVINTNTYEIVFNPMPYSNNQYQVIIENLCKGLNELVSKAWELQQVNKKIRECCKDSCINSEGILHSYYDEIQDEIIPEVIDKNNIYYGNENDSDIQSQPYIIISYRKTVQEVKAEAEALEISQDQIDTIIEDAEIQEQAGIENLNDEISPMCLVLLKYYKKDGKIYYTRATKTVTLEKDINTEMTLYPIAHMVWEEVKGTARGNGEVKYLIPNQIEINKIATRRAIAIKVSAFNKLVVNQELIANPDSLEKVGVTIKLKGGATIQDVQKAVGYLGAKDMSSDASNLQQELQQDTRELAGAGDTATGNVDPTQASGKAILAVKQASEQPLNEQTETYKTFIEDIARIWFDIYKAYKINGIEITLKYTDETGEEIKQLYTVSQEMLKESKTSLKVDITPRSPYDRFAQEQSLEALMSNQKITFEEYVEALEEDSVMPKTKLEKILKKREEKNKQIFKMQQEMKQQEAEIEQRIIQDEKNSEQQFNNIQSELGQRYSRLEQAVGGGQDAMSEM